MLRLFKKIKKLDKCAAVLTFLAAVDFIYIFFVYHLTFIERSTLPNACVEEFVTAIVCFVLLSAADFLRIRHILKKKKKQVLKYAKRSAEAREAQS